MRVLLVLVGGELVVRTSSRGVVVLVVSRSWDQAAEGRRALRRGTGSGVVPYGRRNLVHGRGSRRVHVVVRPNRGAPRRCGRSGHGSLVLLVSMWLLVRVVVVVNGSRGRGAVEAEEFVVRALNVHVVGVTRRADDSGAGGGGRGRAADASVLDGVVGQGELELLLGQTRHGDVRRPQLDDHLLPPCLGSLGKRVPRHRWRGRRQAVVVVRVQRRVEVDARGGRGGRWLSLEDEGGRGRGGRVARTSLRFRDGRRFGFELGCGQVAERGVLLLAVLLDEVRPRVPNGTPREAQRETSVRTSVVACGKKVAEDARVVTAGAAEVSVVALATPGRARRVGVPLLALGTVR